MSLTVKDILEKTFKRSFKGYDENEVDKFLDEIIDEIKALQNDNAALKEALDAEIERAKKTKDTEEAIMHTLVSAQKSAERILAEAAKKAEVIIDSAETTAKKRAENTVKDLGDAQRRLEEVKNNAKALAKRFNDLINSETASFERIFSSYFGEIEGGINIKALEKIDEDITESLRGIEEPQKEAEVKRPVIEKPAPRAAAERPYPKPEDEELYPGIAMERQTPKAAAERPYPKPEFEEPFPGIAIERPVPKAAAERPYPKPEDEELYPGIAMERPAPKAAAERPYPKPEDEELYPGVVMEKPAPKAAAESPYTKPKDEEPVTEEPVTEEFVNASDYDFQLGSGKLMELTEINKVLSEIENSGEDILQEDYETPELSEIPKKKDKRPSYNSIYDDYSWLYGNEEKDEPEGAQPGVVFKDPKEKEELESLIDDIIDNKGI